MYRRLPLALKKPLSFEGVKYFSYLCKVSEQKKHKENTKKKQTTITALCDLYRTFAVEICEGLYYQ